MVSGQNYYWNRYVFLGQYYLEDRKEGKVYNISQRNSSISILPQRRFCTQSNIKLKS